MPGFGGLAGPARALLAAFVTSGAGGSYRRRFEDRAAPSAWVGGPGDPAQPIGTRATSYDPGQQAIIDSTVNAGTGYSGGFATLADVHCVVKRGDSRTAYQAYGMQLAEDATWGVFLASEVVPARGDLYIAADGQRYVVGEQVQPIVVVDQIIGYAAQLERRDATDPVYTA